MNREPVVDPALTRCCLERALASKTFATSPKLRRFLELIVEAKLAGQASRIKAYTIGVEALDRQPDFDPEADSIVRVHAIRLRGLLETYYAGEGQADPVRLILHKGSYIPEFEAADQPRAGLSARPARILLFVERLLLLGGPPEEDYLAAGLTEELVTHLGGYGDSLVVVRTFTESAADHGTSPAPPPRTQDVAYQLRGSLRRQADQIRISFVLTEIATAEVVWSETFAYELSSASLFEVQEQVARKTASRMLDPHGALYRSLKRQPAALLGTYLAVFRYHEYQERFSPESHRRAREELERAVRAEPSYAEAWAALANVDLGEALFGFNRTLPLLDLLDKCLDSAHRAVALDPRSVMAHYILAMILFYRRDAARFRIVAAQALTLGPHRPDNLAVVGMHLALAGDWETGLALVREAMDLNPFHPSWYYLVPSLHHLRFGRDQEALDVIGRFARLEFFPFQINLAVIHGNLGNQAEAQEALRQMQILWPESRDRMRDILSLWFPEEGLADIFAQGLEKAGWSIT